MKSQARFPLRINPSRCLFHICVHVVVRVSVCTHTYTYISIYTRKYTGAFAYMFGIGDITPPRAANPWKSRDVFIAVVCVFQTRGAVHSCRDGGFRVKLINKKTYFLSYHFQRTKTHSAAERVSELVDVPRGDDRSRIAGSPTVHGNTVYSAIGLTDTSDAQTTIQGI